MNIKKQQKWKSISLLVFAFIASLFLFTNCGSDDDVYVAPQVEFAEDGTVPERNEVSFSQESGSKTIEITTNRDWTIKKEEDADWIDITLVKGEEGSTALTITVKSNEGAARKGFFTIQASTAKITIRVNQASVDGKEFKYYTIQELRDMYAENGKDTWTVTEPMLLEAIVTSDRAGGNSNYSA